MLYFGMREHEIGICDDAVHEKRDFPEQLAVADPHPNAAVCIAACPAFPDLAFGIDMPKHRRTALSAADTVADLSDAFAFLDCLIPTPCAFDRDGFFIDILVNDRFKFFIAGVLRILQNPRNPRLIPYTGPLCVWDLLCRQILCDLFKGCTLNVRLENIADNVGLLLFNHGVSVADRVAKR